MEEIHYVHKVDFDYTGHGDGGKNPVTKEDEHDDEEDTAERKKTKTKQRGRQLVKERRVKVTIITIVTWHNNKCKTLTPKVCSSGGKAKEYKLPSIHRYLVL